jgi:hypothetical membrane protein
VTLPARQSTVPWWGLVSAVASPVLLIASWTIAAGVQTSAYDPIKQTVSVLAAYGAADRWIMTLGFFLVGLCDVITGFALRPARPLGRTILLIGAVAGILVGANPETIGAGTTPGHVFFAALGFVALSIWPVAAAYRDSDAPSFLRNRVPWALRWRAGLAGSVVTIALFAWFLLELVTGGALLGLAERALGEMQALWPLVVVAAARLSATSTGLITGKSRELQR